MSTSTPPPLPWEGACRCDELRVRVTEPPLLSAVCHCRGCQRMSSSAYSCTLMLPGSGLEIVRGEPVLGGLRGADAAHQFCDRCKTWVFTRIPQYGVVNLRPTMLDDAEWFAPFIETYVSTKLPWVETPAVQRFEKFPPPESFGELLSSYSRWARDRDWPVAETSPIA